MISIPRNYPWVLALLVLAIITPSTLLGVRFVATNSLACQSCHPWLYALWRQSKVHPKEESDCEDCHIQKKCQSAPLYRSDDNTVSHNCASCHEDLFEQTQVEEVKLIRISHKRHLNENITCSECHQNIAHDKANPPTYRPRKKVCLRCHLREIEGSPEDEGCMMCHFIVLDQKTSLVFGP